MEYASSFSLDKIELFKIDSSTPEIITDLVLEINYYENIAVPCTAITMTLNDTAVNLISSLPIQGGEKVIISLKDTNEKQYEYIMYVYKVSNRFTADRIQVYSLELISIEGLLNEGIRVTKTLKDKPDQIVKDLLENYMKVPSEKIFTDPTQFSIVVQPGKTKPFSIIQKIQSKAVSSDIKVTINDASKESSTNNSTISELPETDSDAYGKLSGTAGYFFYQNYEGFHFKSIDKLSSSSDIAGTFYQSRIEIQDTQNSGPQDKILSINFNNEINVLEKLRLGAYSSLICFYNFSTGAYEEYTFSLDKSYEKMGHQGTQSSIPKAQKDLSKYPTRIMTSIIDHETWFSGEESASPEAKDGGDANAPFPDYQKYYTAQSIARLASVSIQKAEIKLNGRLELKVGDTIKIYIPNQIPTNEKQKEPYDQENSGKYLITSVEHKFHVKKRRCYTFLKVMRDSYGVEGFSSKVGSNSAGDDPLW
jgi:hypothetical protein